MLVSCSVPADWLRFNVLLITIEVILEMLFPGNIVASIDRTEKQIKDKQPQEYKPRLTYITK